MCGMTGIGGMMGGHLSGWMIAWMAFGSLLTLVVVGAAVFVLVAGGRWLWYRSGPNPRPLPTPHP